MSSDITYLATGFYEDCLKLLEIFKSNESVRFEAFYDAWNKLQFSLVFLGRKNYAEMLEFCEEALNIAKQILLSSSGLCDQIGALYLLYALYHKIPVENVKIRVTMREWKIFLDLHELIKEEKLYDASYIFVKLVISHAFYHCLFPTEYGLEKSFKSRPDHSLDNPYSVLSNIVEEIETGELCKIQQLSEIYNEQKIKLLNDITSKNKLQLFEHDFMEEITTQIETLQQKKLTWSEARKKVKEVSIPVRTGKYKFNYEDKIRPKLGHGFDTDSSDDEHIEEISTNFDKSNDSDLPASFEKNDEEIRPKLGHGFDTDSSGDENIEEIATTFEKMNDSDLPACFEKNDDSFE